MDLLWLQLWTGGGSVASKTNINMFCCVYVGCKSCLVPWVQLSFSIHSDTLQKSFKNNSLVCWEHFVHLLYIHYLGFMSKWVKKISSKDHQDFDIINYIQKHFNFRIIKLTLSWINPCSSLCPKVLKNGAIGLIIVNHVVASRRPIKAHSVPLGSRGFTPESNSLLWSFRWHKQVRFVFGLASGKIESAGQKSERVERMEGSPLAPLCQVSLLFSRSVHPCDLSVLSRLM